LKKYALYILALISAGILLVSCSHKKVSFSKETTDAQRMIFFQARYSKTGKKDASLSNNLYYPPALNKFFFRHSMKNGELCYLIELYIPEFKGLIDSESFSWNIYDDGSWVDETVFSLEEERLGAELFDLMENTLEIPSPIEEREILENTEASAASEGAKETDETDESSEVDGSDASTEAAGSDKIPEVAPVESRILDAKNRLKIMEYNSEIFLPLSNKKNSVMVHFFEKKAVRYFYDNFCRLVKKEVWTITDIQNSKIDSSERYLYDEKTGNIIKRESISEQKSAVLEYDQAGNLIKAENYILDKEKKLLNSSTSWTYDKNIRLISEEKLENQFDGEKIIKSITKKEVYEYKRDTDKEGKENLLKYEYYENGDMKIQTVYSGENSYSTSIYFERNYMVTSYYENNKKIRDVYYVDGIERRTKQYE
jgi:antitoxin component YwqK of YwqJK toxin-antitoxin module